MDPGSSSTPARPAVANVVKNSHTDGLGQKEIMKYTTVKISEIRKHPTMRLDAKYWIKKKKKATSRKLQAAMQQDIIYLQRLKKEASSSKLQAPSALKQTQLKGKIKI